MRFHWMDRGDNSHRLDLLENISNIIDNAGYYSMLLVYDSRMHDHWIKAARVLNTKHKFKYMPAIRTYAITPEYASMIYKAFNQISNNRIMFNILSGDIHDGEKSVENLIWLNDRLDTPEKRLEYTDEWTNKFLELVEKDPPEIVMSGHSKKTKLMAEKYKATHLSMLDMYLEAYEKPDFIKNTKQMVALCVVVRDTDEIAENFVNNPVDGWQKKWTIYGSSESVKKKLMDLSNIGITDIIINAHPVDEQVELVHKLISELVKEQ